MHALPKIDLHLHIDGAVRTATMLELAREQGHVLPVSDVNALEHLVRVSPDCRSLTEFLATFDIFYPLLQNPAALRRVSAELCEDLAADNVVYAELRFAPVLNIQNQDDPARARADMQAVVAAVLEGMQVGLQKAGGRLAANLILCCYRGVPVEMARATVEIAAEFAPKNSAANQRSADGAWSPRVCGVDLAGDESRFPAADFQSVFDLARQHDLPVTVHAAEAAGAESARDALDLLGARRLGHGVRIRENTALLQKVIDTGVPLEMCLTSNLQTATVPDLDRHPFRDYLDAGVHVTINTDDPRISGITLSDEWRLATDHFQLSPAEQHKILQNSVAASFTGDDLRADLKKRVDAYFSSESVHG